MPADPASPTATRVDSAGSVSALARCVGDVHAFREQDWGRHPALRRSAGSFSDLLSLDAIDELLRGTALRLPAFRLVQDGTPLDVRRFTRRLRIGGKVVDDVADAAKVHALVGGGATLVLQALHRYWPPLTAFCRSLESVLGHPVQANAYLTPAGSQGLGLHADLHDVFTLQVLGSKSWQAWEPGAGPPDDLPAIDGELGEGDAMYLPRGARHLARTTASPSIHLTIGVLTTSWTAVLDAALAGAPDDLALGRSLPFGWHEDGGFPAAAGEWLGRVAAWLGSLDGAAVAGELRDRAPDRKPVVPPGRLGQVLRASEVGQDTELRHRSDVAVDLQVDGDRVRLVLPDRVVSLPAEVAPALRAVLAHSPLRASDLDGDLDEDGRLVLVRRLVREGVLEVAP